MLGIGDKEVAAGEGKGTRFAEIAILKSERRDTIEIVPCVSRLCFGAQDWLDVAVTGIRDATAVPQLAGLRSSRLALRGQLVEWRYGVPGSRPRASRASIALRALGGLHVCFAGVSAVAACDE
jgi:hypothetical protein